LLKKRTPLSFGATTFLHCKFELTRAFQYSTFLKSDAAAYAVKLKAPTFYWIKNGGSAKNIDVALFLSPSNVIRRDGRGTTDFFIIAPLLASKDNQSRPQSRKLEVRVGDQTYTAIFDARANFDPKRKLHCQVVDPAKMTAGHVAPAQIGILAGVFVKIVPVSGPVDAYGNFDNQLIGTGVGGELNVKDYAAAETTDEDLGSTDFLSIANNLIRLKVDDRELALTPDDWLYVLGSVHGEFGDAKDIRFDGAAKTIWKNGKRLNQTRWERLSTEWQLAVLGWIGGVLYGLFKFLTPVLARLTRDTPFKSN